MKLYNCNVYLMYKDYILEDNIIL